MMTGRAKSQFYWNALNATWILGFIGGETFGLLSRSPDGPITLSRFTFELTQAWPPFVFLLGLAVGTLCEHFWRYLQIKSGWNDVSPLVASPLRYFFLAIGWALIILFSGGPGVFLAGVPIGMLVTRILWMWDPRDAKDRRG